MVVVVMRGSIVCALAALALLQCKVDLDTNAGGNLVDHAGSGGKGSGGAPKGMAGRDSTLGTGGAVVVGSGGIGAAGMAGIGAGGAGAGGKNSGSGGMGSGGMGSGGMGSGGMGSGGMGSGGMGSGGGDAETGRMIGMTAAHNMIRSEVDTDTPLPPMKWSTKIAKYAQEWADGLNGDCQGIHRTTHEYGENIASFGSTAPGSISTAQQAVEGWGGEVACWTYGVFMRTDKCDMNCTSEMSSDGCGHYTQVVWRDSVEVGCGVTTCKRDSFTWDIWVCNYSPAGNFPAEPY